MIILFGVIFYLLNSSFALASNIPLIGQFDAKESVHELLNEQKVNEKMEHINNEESVSFEEDNFLDEESKRLRSLKLLALDVEKTELELKKQGMLIKMLSLENNPAIGLSTKPQGHQDREPNIIVHSILISSSQSIAMISVNNEHYTIIPNQILPNGLIIKSILQSSIQVAFPDGAIRDITYIKG